MADHAPLAPAIDRFRAPRVPVWVTNLALTFILIGLWPLNRIAFEYMDPYFLLIVVLIGINVILATSLNLIIGITGQFSLGHAAFMGLGAYAAGIVLRHYEIREPAGGAINALVMLKLAGALIFGGIIAAAAALIIGIPTLRLRGDYLAIATLGFGEIVFVLIINTEQLGPFYVGGNSGLHGIPIYLNTRFFWTFLWVIVCVVCVWRLVYSTKGKAFLAVREDEIAAAAMGVNTTFYKVAAFAIGAFFAGIAGGLSAIVTGNLDPSSYRFMRSIEIVVMVVLGGSGSISGAILAAAILTFLPEGLRFLKNVTSENFPVNQFRLIIYSLVLIVMMLLRPGGLLGRRELWFTRRRLNAGGAGARRTATVPPVNPPVS
jgi:branched-chain amino acid transport system permease protein